jgi:hypothetical protein
MCGVSQIAADPMARVRLERKLRRDLARFEKIPASRREAECADAGEQLCRDLLAELETAGQGARHV